MGRHLWETYAPAREVFDEAEDLLGWDLRGSVPRRSHRRAHPHRQRAAGHLRVQRGRLARAGGAGRGVRRGRRSLPGGVLRAGGDRAPHLRRRACEWSSGAGGPCTRAARSRRAPWRPSWDWPTRRSTSSAARWATSGRPTTTAPVRWSSPASPRRSPRRASSPRSAERKRVLPLQVSGAFHTPLVAGAARRAGRRARRRGGAARPRRAGSSPRPRCGILRPTRSAEVLVRQLTSPVRFTQSIGALLGDVTSGRGGGPGRRAGRVW